MKKGRKPKPQEPEQLPLKPSKRRRVRVREPKKYCWFRLYFWSDGRSKRFTCEHGAAHFAIGARNKKDGLVNVTCTFGYQHQMPDSYTLKPVDTEG